MPDPSAPRGHFHPDDLQTIRERVQIDELIGQSVTLKRSGSGQFAGLCPFHDERTPSFKVTPARGFYHCFGCGESGDIFDWTKYSLGVEFPEAVRWLADRCGVTLRTLDNTPIASAGPPRKRLLDATSEAQTLFTAALAAAGAEQARRELAQRGFTPADAERHGCGFTPGDSRLVKALTARNYTPDELQAAGLATSLGRDFFGEPRLMWPLADAAGRIVGFAGRTLNPAGAKGRKYINSPATPLFNKSTLLYWLHHAKQAARKTGRILIVEGYTDVMACDAAGIGETVASCGTAFGATHLQVLLRTIDPDCRIVFAFDGDPAGVEATRRAFDVLAAADLLHRGWAVRPPPKQDPCDLRLTGGDQALVDAMGTAVALTEQVLTDTAAAADLSTPEGRAAAARDLAAVLSHITDPTIRSGYVSTAAGLAGVPANHITNHIGNHIGSAGARPQRPTAPASKGGGVERATLGLILTNPTATSAWQGKLDPAWFATTPGRTIATALRAADTATDGWADRIPDQVPDSFRQLVIELLFSTPSPDPAKEIGQCLGRLERRWLETRPAPPRDTASNPTPPPEQAAAAHTEWAATTSRLRALRRPSP